MDWPAQKEAFMAWPAPTDNTTGVVSSWDKTANTMGRSIDSVLWPMLCAKSQLLDRIPRFNVDNVELEWESANTNARVFTADAHHTETGIDAHATGSYIGIGGVSDYANVFQ